MATPNFTMVFLDFEDSVTFVHGSCTVRSSFVHRLVVGVLQRCRGYMEKALRRSRAWKNWRGREKKRVKDEAPGRPWPPLAMANVTDLEILVMDSNISNDL